MIPFVEKLTGTTSRLAPTIELATAMAVLNGLLLMSG